MVPSLHTPRWQVFLILSSGVFCVSTAAIFIRLALVAVDAPGVGFSLVLASSRLMLASLLLLPTWQTFCRTAYSRRAIAYSLVSGLSLAVHFGTWITSLSYTSIAASTTLVTTNPVWVALLSWLWFREAISAQIIVGIAVTLAGSIGIGLQDTGGLTAGQNPLLGNSLALIGSWMVSLYLLLGREAQRRGIKIQHHAAIAYTTAAIVLLPMPLLLGSSYGGYAPQVYGCIVLMAVVPQLIGHTSLNWAVHQISPTLVTLAILLEPIGSSLLGYLVFGEKPGLGVLAGAGFILVGVAIAATASQHQSPQPPPETL